MHISINICQFTKYGGNEEILKLLKEAGFDAYDFSMYGSNPDRFIDGDDYLEKAAALRKFADGIGIVCNQTHAPFPTAKIGDENYNREIIPVLKRSIEVSGILGGKISVVHPCNNYNAQQNAELYSQLLDTAKKSNVILAVENMWNWEKGENNACAAACSHHDDFWEHLELLDKRWFTACLDIGHAAMKGLDTSPSQMIKKLAPRLGALHIHDNDGFHDNHARPYSMGGVDFDEVLSCLKDNGYKGDITLETEDKFIKNAPRETVLTATKNLAAIADFFRSKLI